MEGEAPDDTELKLLHDSAKLLDELKTSIPLFLYKNVGSPRPVKIRKLVKRSNTARLESLFNTFLESPQLLDPILRDVLEPLVSCFKDYIQNHSDLYSRWTTNDESTAEPLPRALCRLLYTLCKVRGVKVIVNFLSNEPSMLEPVLDAFEKWNPERDEAKSNSIRAIDELTWEEKFVMLLWMSHLARTPFDLASISSSDPRRDLSSQLPIPIPLGLPDIACRLLALGFRYIESNTKEQEAAKLLLVRLCMRPDIIRFGLHEKCVTWALHSLKFAPRDRQDDSVYSKIGRLSFLAGFFSGSDSTVAARFIDPMLHFTHEMISSSIDLAKMMNESAVVRKSVMKIYRSCAMHLLFGRFAPGIIEVDDYAALGTTVDHIMNGVGDKDSPVRFAASKALSMIARRLNDDMALQLVDDIILRLQQDVVQGKGESKDSVPLDPALFKPNTSSVDPLQWQGLILTLSHLLFRRSLPQNCLSTVVNNIATGLDFEQRSSMGMSIGSGVRDAACFGVWSLARKYTTAELLQVAPSTIPTRWASYKYKSIFEVLAAELVVTATLDPEGNVRRAASAALQELIGRHPDMVPDGIALVQIVDYHAVGLRSRAMSTVALQAAGLRKVYLFAVLDGLLSWRAINSPEVAVRRQAASTVAHVFDFHGCAPMTQLYQRFQSSKDRSLSEWHGLYLALAAAVRHSVVSVHYAERIIQIISVSNSAFKNDHVYLLRGDAPLSSDDLTKAGKDTYLVAEALCTVITALGKYSVDGRLDHHKTILESAVKHCPGVPMRVYSDTAVTVFNRYTTSGQKRLLNEWLIEIKERSWIRRDPKTGSLIDHDMQLLYGLLIDCLDDYSVINSRDVGSQVRRGALHAIKTLDRSPGWSHDQRAMVFAKVYGLAAEKNDQVRESAWSCLGEFPDAVFCKKDRKTMMAKSKLGEPLSTSDSTYFGYLITSCNHTLLRESTVRGLITSASSGSQSLVCASRRAIISSFETLSSQVVDQFYSILLDIIQEAIPDGRLLRPGLEVLGFLLDVDLDLRLTDNISAWTSLLEALPSIRQSTDLRNLEANVRICAGLSRYDGLRKQALDSLHDFLGHRYPKIRLAAAAALYVVEPKDQLKAMDLSGSVPRIKREVRALYGDGSGLEGEVQE
ncbi:MAG: hypothetical protein Q9216_006647 [Gyalolechia sp. 2 TL-2023]